MAEPYRLYSKPLTHPGRKRHNNEDFVTSYEPPDIVTLTNFGSLYIVADGVGGAEKGEKASEYAAKKVLYDYYATADGDPISRISTAVRNASRDIYEFSQRDENGGQMATTFVAALVLGDQLIVANVGDSRCYLIHNGMIQQVTKDHSFTGEMVEDGVMTEEEAMHSKVKNRLTRSVGGDSSVKVDIFPAIPLFSGDRIILCSDGLTRYALKEDIQHLASSGNVDEAAARLIDFANNSGGADNVTVLVVEVGKPLSQATDTVISSRVVLPAAVDWDSMTTEHSFVRPSRNQSFQKNYLPWIILAVVVLVALAGTVTWIGVKDLQKMRPTMTPSPIPTLTPSETPTSMPPTATFTEAPTATSLVLAIDQSQTPGPSETFTETPTASPTLTVDLIASSTPTLTITPIVLSSATPEGLVECLVWQRKVNLLFDAAYPLGVWKEGDQYFYRNCEPENGIPISCTTDRVLIPYNNYPNPQEDITYFFSFLNIDRQKCTENTGNPWPK